MEEDVGDFYFCRIDEAHGSIFFNDSVESRAPLPGHDKLVVLSLRMQSPRDDGLSSSEEFDALLKIEELVEKTLAPPRAFYVGRATHAGLRDFYFYTGDTDQAISSVDEAMINFPHYEFTTPVEEDADWRIYREFLYPSPRDRQRIENRKVCDSLSEHGDKLMAKREIDHWAYFPAAEACELFIARAVAEGFQLRSRMKPSKERNAFGVQLVRVDHASWDEINEVTLRLFEVAEEFGGDYDGWESSAVRD